MHLINQAQNIFRLNIIIVFISIFLFSSCSTWLSTQRRTLFGVEKNKKSKTVSYEQYEQLMKDYKGVNSKYQNLKAKHGESNQSMQINNLDKSLTVDIKPISKDQEGLVETVDVFGTKQTSKIYTSRNNQIKIKAISDIHFPSSEEEIQGLRKAVQLFNQRKFDEAVKYFHVLSNSKSKQIRVRSRFYIGRLFFEQKEYDLALQSFEDVLNKYAFSGYVIHSLKYLITCCEKLGLKKKKGKYYSFLHDFFG